MDRWNALGKALPWAGVALTCWKAYKDNIHFNNQPDARYEIECKKITDKYKRDKLIFVARNKGNIKVSVRWLGINDALRKSRTFIKPISEKDKEEWVALEPGDIKTICEPDTIFIENLIGDTGPITIRAAFQGSQKKDIKILKAKINENELPAASIVKPEIIVEEKTKLPNNYIQEYVSFRKH